MNAECPEDKCSSLHQNLAVVVNNDYTHILRLHIDQLIFHESLYITSAGFLVGII